MDMSRELLLQRLKLKGLSLTEASVKIGRNASYLQQFVKRGTPVELRERERQQLALLLGVDETQLRGTLVGQETFSNTKSSIENKEPPTLSQKQNDSIDNPRTVSLLSRDLPVYGFALQGLDGLFVVTNRPVDFMPRPDFLANNTNAYSLIAPDDRMSPEIKAGDMLAMNPLLPCRDGDTCLFRKNRIGDEGILASLVSSSPKTWNICQHIAPKKIIELDKITFPIADPIVARYCR
jgi:hypothetical protein